MNSSCPTAAWRMNSFVERSMNPGTSPRSTTSMSTFSASTSCFPSFLASSAMEIRRYVLTHDENSISSFSRRFAFRPRKRKMIPGTSAVGVHSAEDREVRRLVIGPADVIRHADDDSDREEQQSEDAQGHVQRPFHPPPARRHAGRKGLDSRYFNAPSGREGRNHDTGLGILK